MTLEVRMRINLEDKEKFRAIVQSAGGEILSETPRPLSQGKQRERQRLLGEFIAESSPKSPEVEEKIVAGYGRLLTDIRRVVPDRRFVGELPPNINITTLKEQFAVFVREDTPAWTSTKLALIYLYGLQDGVERKPEEAVHILGYKNIRHLISFGRHLLYNRLTEPQT